VAALTLPPAVPPETKGLAPGYFLIAHSCVTNSRNPLRISAAAAVQEAQLQSTQLSPDDPRAKRLYGLATNPSGYYGYAARYYAARNNYDRAATFYARALKALLKENVAPGSVDLMRLSMSIALYRAHRIRETKPLWRLLVAPRSRFTASPDDATRAALDKRFHDALIRYARTPQGFNMVFQDNGAAYNLQRGLNAAATNDIPDARKFLGYSLECSAFFPVPHLILGVIDAMDSDYTAARHEWIVDLEGGEPDPPDTAGLMTAQYDALYLLLKFD